MSVNCTFKTPFSSLQGYRSFSAVRSFSRVSRSVRFHQMKRFLCIVEQYKPQTMCSTTGNNDIASDVYDSSIDQAGLEETNGNQRRKMFSINEMMERLRRYGRAGVLSYGLLNTAYYLTTFLFVWIYVAPAPGGMGYGAAVQRFLKIIAMVWAGSQVTKLLRVAGALALAPIVDRGLSWFTTKFRFQSQGKAFIAIVGVCFAMAFLLFFVVTLLWA